MFVLAISGFSMMVASADSLESAHYQFVESSLGNSSMLQSNSAHYQLGSSLGDTAIGNSGSDNFQVNAGSKTTGDPTLAFSVNQGSANFGSFSPGQTATATSTFSVSDYTSYGYAVQIVGKPPTNGSHTLPAMATTDFPTTGIEEFGINLVANTLPTSFGANPDLGQFGAGKAAPNYATLNKFRYVSGETIATAPKSSGITNFTISYVVDVKGLTPGGQYTSDQTIICTGVY
jgi:hypothetical protein